MSARQPIQVAGPAVAAEGHVAGAECASWLARPQDAAAGGIVPDSGLLVVVVSAQPESAPAQTASMRDS